MLAAKVGAQKGLFGSQALLPLILPAIADHELTDNDHVSYYFSLTVLLASVSVAEFLPV